MPDRFDHVSLLLGVKTSVLVATFAGAMAAAIVLKVRSPWQLLGLVTVGLLTSIYLGPLIVDQVERMGFSNVDRSDLSNAAGFLAGLASMAILNGIVNTIHRIGRGNRGGGQEGRS
jgi:hypothetical protein